MTTRGEAFAGLSVATITPFRNGDVDFDALGRQIEFQIAAGTQCICPVGTTGESPTLSHSEHDQVIARSVEFAAGRIKVMAGSGSNSTAEALRLTVTAERAGADAALVVAPYYNKPTQEGFYQHYKALAEAVELMNYKDRIFRGVPRLVYVFVSKYSPSEILGNPQLREQFFKAQKHNVIVNIDGHAVVDNPMSICQRLLKQTLGSCFDTPMVEELPEEDDQKVSFRR